MAMEQIVDVPLRGNTVNNTRLTWSPCYARLSRMNDNRQLTGADRATWRRPRLKAPLTLYTLHTERHIQMNAILTSLISGKSMHTAINAPRLFVHTTR